MQTDHVLTTRRLNLRKPSVADIDAILDIHSDPKATAHNPGDALASRREAEDLLRRWEAHWADHGFGYFVVCLRDNNATVGFCGVKLMAFRGEQVLNLFYRFAPAYWGRGFATEAVEAVVNFVDREVSDRALIARVRPENVASQRIATKLGFVRHPSLTEQGEDGLDHIYTRPRPGNPGG